MRVVVLTQLLVGAVFALAGPAAAEPVSGPHQTIDNQFTTTQPNAPTGSTYVGRYHAAGDPEGDPPYMRAMTFYPPPGTRYDTSVPERCTASDLELQARGTAACPAGSHIGSGTVESKFMGMDGSEATLRVDVFNNTGEMIMLVSSPGLTSVARGKFQPDGSIEYRSPTCFPATAGCPVDNALQLGSNVSMPPYVRTVDGVTKSYLTTPPTCPKSGYWESPIGFWWADGTSEIVVTSQACTRKPYAG